MSDTRKDPESQRTDAPSATAEVEVRALSAAEAPPERLAPTVETPLPPLAKPIRRNAEAERYSVKLPAFEGPLDLLLHLIQEHQLEIADVPIAFIAEKYIEFLDVMRELNLDVAGEYLLMAATLAHIKSKTLLPKEEGAPDDEEPDDVDPRGSLIRRLLEYQKYKHAAENLQSRPLLTRDVFTRAPSNEDQPREDAPLAEVSVFQLLNVFAEVLKRVGGRLHHEVEIDRLSVSERISQLSDRLRDIDRIELLQLFEGMVERHLLVVTFLALLEMTRLKMVRLFQDDRRGPIWITSTGVHGTPFDGDAAFEYRARPLEMANVAPPRPLTPEEEATLRELDGDDEAAREEAAYAAFDDDEDDQDDEEDERRERDQEE